MSRRLRKRVDAIWEATGADAEALLAALYELRRTGTAPPGPAGETAARYWDDAAEFSRDDVWRTFWCELRITGMTVAEYFARGTQVLRAPETT